MLDAKTDNLVRDLVRLLSDLMGLHAEMVMHMRSKLEAIKTADSDRIQSITARELLLASRAREREGLRRQIAERIAEGLGIDRSRGRSMKLTELAELLPEPRRSQLLVSAAGLREKLEELARLQQTTAVVTEQMLVHLGEVLRVMTAGTGPSDVYSSSGRRSVPHAANVFEAVG